MGKLQPVCKACGARFVKGSLWLFRLNHRGCKTSDEVERERIARMRGKKEGGGAMNICTCGHTDDEHLAEGIFSPCDINGCDCGDFDLERVE